jgi:flagellar FliJ protein
VKRFLFRLEPLLNLRRLKEQQALEAFAREVAEQQRLEAELSRRTARLQQALAGTGAGEPSARALAERQAFVERRERERAETAERLLLQTRRVEAQREQLAELVREREVVERLRERAHERHEHEEAQRQSTLLDELATQGHARKAKAAEA